MQRVAFWAAGLGVWSLVASVGLGCGSDSDSGGAAGADGGSGASGGSGGSGGGTGTVIAACHTGDGPTKGCSEIPMAASAVQAWKEVCTSAGSVASDSCPTAGANATCVPAPGSLGVLTPNVIYLFGLADAADYDKAKKNCEAMGGTFTTL